jgi:hypothetical protein
MRTNILYSNRCTAPDLQEHKEYNFKYTCEERKVNYAFPIIELEVFPNLFQ